MIDFIIKYWLEFAFGLLIMGTGVVCTWMKRKFKEHDDLRNGLQAILRNDIIKMHDKYMEKEYIPIYALDSVNKMYSAYHKLGGNGTVTKLVEEMQELPTEKQGG